MTKKQIKSLKKKISISLDRIDYLLSKVEDYALQGKIHTNGRLHDEFECLEHDAEFVALCCVNYLQDWSKDISC